MEWITMSLRPIITNFFEILSGVSQYMYLIWSSKLVNKFLRWTIDHIWANFQYLVMLIFLVTNADHLITSYIYVSPQFSLVFDDLFEFF